MRKGGIWLLVAVAFGLAGASTALASSWTVQRSPNTDGAVQAVLSDVSCASATACIAVGDGAVERRDGFRWSLQPIPTPAGATHIYPNGVSCTSPNACTLVGEYYNPADTQVTLAERWDGVRWSIQATPNPPNPNYGSELSAVSCSSRTDCTAVGNDNGSTTLIERWDGTSWSIQPSPTPITATNRYPAVDLASVSCTSPIACTAVGSHSDPADRLATLAERWDGDSWSIQRTPTPADASGTALGVSCSSPSACVGVGSYIPAGSPYGTVFALAERWGGSGWSIQPTLAPNGSLMSVSCGSKTACVAVGGYTSADGAEAMLAERWNRTT